MLHENEIKALFFEKIQTDAPDRFKTMKVYRIPVMIAGVSQWATVKNGDVTFTDVHDNVTPILTINKGEIEERIKASVADAKKKPKQKPAKEPKQKQVKDTKKKPTKEKPEADVVCGDDVLDPGEAVTKKKKHVIFPIFVAISTGVVFCFKFNGIQLFDPEFLKRGMFGKLSFVLVCLTILLNVIAFIATIAGNANKDVTKPNKLCSKVFLWVLGLFCFAGSIVCAVQSIMDFMSVMFGG